MAFTQGQRGGARPGAGRPKGSPTIRNASIARKYGEDGGLTPLDVLILTMRDAYAARNLDLAVDCAKSAAPYCHPKLQNIQAVVTDAEGNSVNTAPQITISFSNSPIPEAKVIPSLPAPAIAAIAAAEEDIIDVEDEAE